MLSQQVEQLKASQQQIISKDETIKAKDERLFITSFSIAIVSGFAVVIVVLFYRNQKTTRKLKETLERLRSAQQQLVESEKMASLGLLTAGVAHEMNTPLGSMVTSMSTLVDRMEGLEKQIQSGSISKSSLIDTVENVKSAAEICGNSLKHATSLVDSFKELAVENAPEQTQQVDINMLLQLLVSSENARLQQSHIRCEIVGDDSVVVESKKNALNQVFERLINNAMLHAFDGVEDPQITISVKQLDNGGAKIEFADNGIGMRPETLEKVFEPFYTTKRNQGGTGLGLNILYNNVQQKLHGSVEVDSALGEGTRFTLELPPSP